MSEQYGTYAPPPEVPGMPPQPEPFGQPPARKPKTGLIIAVVVSIIVALCGCSVIAGVLLFRTAETTGGSTVIETTVTETDESTSEPITDDRLAEWMGWDPTVIEALPEAPADDIALLVQAVEVLAPGFTLADTGYSAGWIDEAEDWYYGDLYLVRATHPSSNKVSAALEFSLQSDDMIADDVPFEAQDGDVIDTIAGGTIEMISSGAFENPDFPVDSPDGEALWRTIGEDWPQAVVMRIWTESDTEVTVSLTKWRQYDIDEYSPRVYAVYQLSGGEWELLAWEYDSGDDLPEESTDEAPVT